MPPAEVTLTTRKPEPPKADFAFYIDFQRGVGPASRVFSATSDFIRACERFDRELVKSVDSNIETVMVLEDIEVGSLKTWLRNTLNATEDQALKELDWRPAVGKYLVRAKYVVLRWIDDEEIPKDLLALGREIRKLAAETDVRHLPDYTPVEPQTLITALENFQVVKDHLTEGDHASIITPEGDHEMNLRIRLDVDDIKDFATSEVQTFQVPSMILVVKKPDYLGTSKWDLRFGKQTLSVKVSDEEWLDSFQGRSIDVRPGDALRCDVEIEHFYGYDNELIGQQYTILKVHEVLADQFYQGELFDDKDG